MSSTLSPQEIGDWFDKYVFGYIYHDIEVAINGDANLMAALALSAYTEFMGGLVMGKFERGEERANYEKFLEDYMPSD